jgi:uncharacterized protein YndB with AHSA1/START domain
MSPSVPSSRSLVIERELPHPPAKVWRALTEGPLFEQWLMANDFIPVVGHSFTLRATPMPNWNGVIAGVVLAVEPNARLSYSWGSLGLDTVVTWTLAPSPVGTLVRMEQSGFPPDREANYQGANHGWQKFVAGLERVVGALR